MKRAFQLSAFAGLCLAAPAFAGEDTLVPAGAPKRVPASALSMPTIPFGERANTNVYEIVDTDNLVFTNTALPVQLLDDVSVIPGPGSAGTFPLTINGMFVSFDVDASLQSFDIEVTFWDSVNVTAPAGSPVHTDFIDGFIVAVDASALPGAGAYVTDTIDLTGLPNAGIVLPDAGVFVRIRYLVPDSDPAVLMPSGSVEIVYDATNDATTFASNVIGATDINTWRDVTPSGGSPNGIIEASEARSFAYPGRGGALIGLQADVPVGGGGCAADFNGDGFLDFFDYDGYVEAFETGC
jgi:hypothetical protein